MTLSFLIVCVVVGCIVGFAAGLLGIGGGTVMVPVFTLIFTIYGFPDQYVIHIAIATSLAVIFFTSISSVYAHNRKKAVLWQVAGALVPGVLVGAWIGPMIAARLNTRLLGLVFAVFILVAAWRMLKKKKRRTKVARVPGAPTMAAAGLGIGTLSGIVGAGGGFITVPFLTWCGVVIHNAVATSAVMGFPIALSGSVSYIVEGWGLHGLPTGSFGFVYLPALLCVAPASVLTAPLGAKLAHRLQVQQLRAVFGWVLVALAIYMLSKAF